LRAFELHASIAVEVIHPVILSRLEFPVIASSHFTDSIKMLCQLLKAIKEEQNVFLFLPNLIGYARIVFAILACLTMLHCPITTLIFYFLSAFLDAFDGYAARAFNQSTKFGGLLDQLTDRCGTLCLIFVSFVLFFSLSNIRF